MLDLKNPDHEAALRWACALRMNEQSLPEVPERSAQLRMHILNDILSSPASAAELIRQLVRRAGPEAVSDVCGPSGIGAVLYCCLVAGHGGGRWRSWPDNDASKVIARLLALAPNAGACPVLEALRGDA